MFDIRDKVTVITGAAGGIGAQLAKGFHAHGAAVLGVDIAPIEHDGIVPIQCDLRDPDAIGRAAEAAIERFGRVDVLINNAGINEIVSAESMAFEVWNNTLSLNLTGTFLLSQAIGRHMIAARSGAIINMASRCAYIGMPFGAAYNASKAGILSLTRTLAVEWAVYGIRVNAIVPGVVQTSMNDHRETAEGRLFESTIPLGRVSTPEDLVGPAIFLASDAARYMTGEALVVDGGNLMADGIGVLYRDFKRAKDGVASTETSGLA